jgi:hypothetical protein
MQPANCILRRAAICGRIWSDAISSGSPDIGSDPMKQGRRGLEEGVEGLPSGSVGLPNPDAATIADSPSRSTLAGLGANTDLCLGKTPRRLHALLRYAPPWYKQLPHLRAVTQAASRIPSVLGQSR